MSCRGLSVLISVLFSFSTKAFEEHWPDHSGPKISICYKKDYG